MRMNDDTKQPTLFDPPPANGTPEASHSLAKSVFEKWALKDCGRWLSGGTPTRNNPAYWGGDIPWISAKSLKHFYIYDSNEYVTEAGAMNGTRLVPPGTILFVVRGMSLANEFRIGIAQRSVTFNQDLKALIANEHFDPLFLAYMLKAKEKYIMNLADASSHGTLRLQTELLEQLPIPLPPLPEQRKIARILGAWDRALSDLDALLAAKRRRKQGLAQRLLTGRVRLPGFDEPWREVKIGQLLKPVKRPVDWDDKRLYRLVSLRRGGEGLFWRSPLYGHQISTKTLMVTRTGDFLISRMQVVHGATGLTTPEFDGAHVSNSYLILVPRKENIIDTAFFAELSKQPFMRHLAYLSSYGVHIEKMTFNPRLYFNSKISIPPTVEEQREIKKVLDAADAEIAALEAWRAALARQKKGLMQRLLTGEIRVRLEEGDNPDLSGLRDLNRSTTTPTTSTTPPTPHRDNPDLSGLGDLNRSTTTPTTSTTPPTPHRDNPDLSGLGDLNRSTTTPITPRRDNPAGDNPDLNRSGGGDTS